MYIYNTNTDNPIVEEIYDFYCVMYKKKLAEGMSRADASSYTLDAIELRYCIRRSRAIQIVYAMRKSGKTLDEKKRTSYFANNIELIGIINEINEEYRNRRD